MIMVDRYVVGCYDRGRDTWWAVMIVVEIYMAGCYDRGRDIRGRLL